MYKDIFTNYAHPTHLHAKRPHVCQNISYNYEWSNECISPTSSLNMYVNDSTYYKNLASCQSLCLHSRINLHTKTTAHTIIKKSWQTPIMHIFTTTSLHNHMYNTHSLKTKFIISFITKKEQKLSHLILSCPRISIFGEMVGNPLTASQHMVWGTL